MAVALDVEVRLLRPEDAPQVAALLVDAFAEEFEGAGTEFQSVVRQMRSGGWAQRGPWRRLASLAGVEFGFFVAMYGRRVVGCAGIMGQRLPVINSVAVHPEFRRRGIAELLVRAAEDFAAQHGHDSVVLDVLAHNTPALNLYLKMGYAEYHRYRTYARADLSPVREPGRQTPEGGRQQPLEPPFPLTSAFSLLPSGSARVGGVTLPPDYRLEPPRGELAAAFDRVEREALPERFRAVAPTLRPRYTGGTPSLVEWLVAGVRSCRRAVLYQGTPVGYLAAHMASGVREGRIEYPLLGPRHAEALPGALAELASFIARAGGGSARIDLSEDRPDQHAVAEDLGFAHRWTFAQMVKRLSRGVRIPVRAAGLSKADGGQNGNRQDAKDAKIGEGS